MEDLDPAPLSVAGPISASDVEDRQEEFLAFEDAEAGASGHGPGSAVDLGPASAACCPDNRWE